MQYLLKTIIPIQISLIVIIVITFWQAYKILRKESFLWLSIAWIFNLAYLIFTIISKAFVESNNTYFIEIIIIIFNIISTYFFYFATHKSFNTLQRFKLKRVNSIYISSLIFFGLISIIPSFSIIDLPTLLILRNIPLCLINFLTLILVGSFVRSIEKKYSVKYLASIGFFIYATVQLIGAAEFFNLDEKTWEGFELLGYSIGLVSKFMIYLGINFIFIHVAKESYGDHILKDRLDKILGKTYHELKDPTREIDDQLGILFSKDNNEIFFNKLARNHIQIIEKEQIKINSILQASLRMYETYMEKDLDSDLSLDSNESLELANINTLVEIAIFSVKGVINSNAKNEYESEKLKIIRDYGKNCDIICYPTDIIRIFINLLKNSYEAFENNKGKIIIRTRVIKSFSENMVFIEIEDNGCGIDEKIKDKVFLAGFSTKLKKISGYGLNIVKELINRNNGIIKLESPPIKKHLYHSNKGTKFIIAFKQS